MNQKKIHDPNEWMGRRQPQIAVISNELLEDELWIAIVAASTCDDSEDCDFDLIDDELARDSEYHNIPEEQRVLLSLLSTLRPWLAELLGGPPAD
jgi:hypothetical protein